MALSWRQGGVNGGGAVPERLPARQGRKLAHSPVLKGRGKMGFFPGFAAVQAAGHCCPNGVGRIRRAAEAGVHGSQKHPLPGGQQGGNAVVRAAKGGAGGKGEGFRKSVGHVRRRLSVFCPKRMVAYYERGRKENLPLGLPPPPHSAIIGEKTGPSGPAGGSHGTKTCV